MSLFDVIRYPITDIYNSDCIERIPDVIFTKWFRECYFQLNPSETEIPESMQWKSTWVIRLCIISYTQEGTYEYDDIEPYLKDMFTNRLKKLIKEYEY